MPRLDGGLFVTDGGIETTLTSHEGLVLPCFAAFPLLDSEAGVDALRRYSGPYAVLAGELGAGLVLESPTWRAAGAGPVAISACIGPQGDAYRPERLLGADEARAHHSRQISPAYSMVNCARPAHRHVGELCRAWLAA